MVAANSQMLPLGTPAPVFSLVDTEGKTISLADAGGAPATVVMFICNHCPYVVHIADELAKLGHDYKGRGVAIFAISSNDVENYPADDLAKMAVEKANRGYNFPYLYDETQDVAKAYQAACTPDFFVFDGEHKLVYRGQFDDARPRNDAPVNGKDVRAALDAVLAGNAVSDDQVPSIGCNIKWKPGQAPAYFS